MCVTTSSRTLLPASRSTSDASPYITTPPAGDRLGGEQNAPVLIADAI